jgi:non-homologous end joining protein Ku
MSNCSIVLVFVVHLKKYVMVSISQVLDALSHEKSKNPRICTFVGNTHVEKYMYTKCYLSSPQNLKILQLMLRIAN